ncbi:hypothetical protein AB0A94_30495 [Streptomyces sp. NPDC044984]|uniref:hypothetical protein n=1 Tax=Streptomyces sp. NPDC044984 TaxID=3154335 RepID=UPI0033D4844F
MRHVSAGATGPARTVVSLVGALCAGTLLCALTACSPSSSPTSSSKETATRDEADGGQRVPYWIKGVTPEEVAERLHVTVPAGATDRRAAHQKGFQDDGLLLAFTLPGTDTGEFVEDLAPENPLSHRKAPLPSAAEVEQTTPFTRLGLKEPETLADVTEGPVCAPCQGDLDSLFVAVHPVDAQHSRVYLRGVD